MVIGANWLTRQREREKERDATSGKQGQESECVNECRIKREMVQFERNTERKVKH